jgi:polyribonucleotide nucleotidyltransferase
MAVTRVEIELGGRTLSIETGKLAKQADGACIVQFGETVVLGTAVRASPREGIDFFPLTVDYREKMNAAGKFPGGFRKREGAPNAKEILTMRNIDRPIRPLFPKGFFDEVQIQCWVLAADGQNEPDVLASIAGSVALALSTIPFEGPIASLRIGRVEGRLVVMPTAAQAEFSDLDMLLSGHKDGLNMIEVGAAEIPESEMVEAVEFGFDQIKLLVAKIEELVAKAGKAKRIDSLRLPSDDIVKLTEAKLAGPMRTAKTSPGTKLERQDAVNESIKNFIATEFPEPAPTSGYGETVAWQQRVKEAKIAIHDLEEKITKQVIQSGIRTDGRRNEDLREITCEAGVLPRVHGSAVFTRGETQALVTVTLGTGRNEQIIEGLGEDYAEKFYLHYNFPPFSVGEAKRITGPSRRDVGHGKLAERALAAVLPPLEKFPYTVRVVSDILESNGSSSMASACGGTLALMDAGVPITSPVAGISIGLIAADDAGGPEVYLTDIQGEEDHFGDMDFKVTGTRTGVTAIQLDLKIRGLNMAQVRRSFDEARTGRLKILDMIEQEIKAPRDSISPHAPRLLTTTINPDKIGRLIGPGGKMIRELEATTGATIEVAEDGTVTVSAAGGGKAEAAIEKINSLCAEVKLDEIYNGKVCSVKDFGAFVEIFPGQDGLCHISELADGYVDKVADVVKVGDEIRVKVILVDDQGRVKLSRRKALQEDEGRKEPEDEPSVARS